MNRIDQLRRNRQYEQALEAVHRFRAAGVDSVQLAVEEADLLARLRRPGPALAVLEAWREELPEYGRALLAGLLEHHGRSQEANPIFDALAAEPRLSLGVARRVARNLLARGFQDQAVQLAERTARPTPPELVWLARCYLAADRREQARESLERALHRSPEHPPALQEWARLCPEPLGLIPVLRGHSPEVVTRALERLAQIWRELGQPELARTALEECCRREPGNAYCLANLGYVLRELGQLGPALVCLELALELDPDDPVTFTAYLATCREARDPKRAAAYILGRIKTEPAARRLWGRYRKFFGRGRGATT